MDTDALHSALISIALIANKLCATRQALLEEGASAAIHEVLAHAESDLKMAKAIMAAELGFQVCDTCSPPEVLVPDFGKVLRCPQCETFSIGTGQRNGVLIAKTQLLLWQESAPDKTSVLALK